jgi:hypothetical protein
MNKKLWFLLVSVVLVALAVVVPCLWSGELPAAGNYQVLAPIRHGSLTIFPVVSGRSHDAGQFLTLDEGLRSGEVIVSESGSVSPLVRPRHNHVRLEPLQHRDGAQVNRLVLVNNSKRPLLLLAGEIVTGGKQDRVIGSDRIVPAESDPIDLSVFCVEPGRWVGTSANFNAPAASAGYMLQPSVRAKAMADKNQQKVWDEVGKARMTMSETVQVSGAAPEVAQTSSYAGVVENRAVRKQVDSVTAPIQHEYQSVISQLRDRNAVGVVVAVNGEIIWADVFASSKLLEKYWPKLVRSYAAESFSQSTKSERVSEKAAQEFLDRLQGKREVVESEPGLYRHTEISGDGFRVFELASLLPGTGFDVHFAKMAE